MSIDLFKCLQTDSIIEALKKMNINKRSFLIVVDDDNNVVGTLTDGDIRRYLIKSGSIDNIVDNICNKKYQKLYYSNNIYDAINMFKNESIKFLPITKENKLFNILTKAQLQTVLLKDMQVGLDYDFTSLDDNIINTEIFSKPWGFYKTTILNDYYQSKVLTLNSGQQISLQSHKHRDEYWIIVHGIGLFTLNKNTQEVRQGDMLYIPKKSKHRIKNIDDKESLIITEVQIGDYFGEDDIVRYDDDYQRD